MWRVHFVTRQLIFPIRLPVMRGGGARKAGAHVPKAQGLKRRGRDPQLCNTEGTIGYDRLKNVLCIVVRLSGVHLLICL